MLGSKVFEGGFSTGRRFPDPRSTRTESSYNLTHTGANGDKHRWRLPYPFTSPGYAPPHANIGGMRFGGMSVLGCQEACDADERCEGLFVDSS